MSFEKLNSDHIACSPELFLDTSIHCSKLKGSLFNDRIEKVFALFKWKSTSTYAKVEYGNVVLGQVEYFLDKLHEFKSLEKALDFIANVLPHKLHPAKVTWSFNLLKAYGADDTECTERARHSLRLLMKLGVAFVEELCDRPLANGTDCYWARVGVHKRKDGRLEWRTPICKRTRKRCRLDDFFADNKDVFEKIKVAIDSLPEDRKTAQLRAFSDVIGQAMLDPGMLLDYRPGCKRLADAIIAVDSLGYKSIFSQNTAESEVLTTVLGQAFYYLPPNPEQGVLVQLPPPA